MTVSGNLTNLNNYFNVASNITYLHGTAHTNGDNADTIQMNVNDNGNTGTGGGTDIDLGTVNVDISAVNDDPANAGSLPSDISVTEDVSSIVDLSAVNFSDVDAAAGNLTVTLTTSTGGDLTGAAGTGITLGGTPMALTVSGNLTDLNNYFNTASNITYLHGTPGTNGDNADTIQVEISDNGNTGSGGGGNINLGTVNVDIGAINDEEVLTTNTGVTVDEGDTGTLITRLMLETTDVDNAATQLAYTVSSSPLSGTLRLSGGVLSGGATFTQADINAGLLTYDHNDTEIFVDSFSFSVDDGAGTVSGGSFGITINPINDNDPVISSDGGGGSAAVSVAENVTAATTVTAADADLPAQTLSYSIFGGSDAGRFNIDSVSGVLTFAAAPNFEAPTDADMDNQYDVIVEVSDGQGRTDQQTIQVTVTDVDEFDVSPIVDNDASPNQVSENSAPGTILGLIAFSSDLDGTSNTVTYTLDDDAGGLIQIDGSSGVVRTASAVDFEMTGASLSIVVRATSDDSSSTTRGFTIAVTDVNEAPVLLSAGPFAVNENSATGTVVGSVTSNDPDTGDTRFYSISGGNTGGAFTIDSATGQITVTNTGALNYETLNAFALTVQVADSAGLTDSTIVAINLSDINEVPTDIVITGGAVAENSENGTLVGTVNVTDPDAGDTATWNLIDSAAGRFAVDASTGAITVADSTRLDFETDDSHTITVRTTDSGGLNYSKTFTIAITNANESPVAQDDVFEARQFETLSVTSSSVLDNDSDVDGDTLTAVLVAGPGNGSLTLNPDGTFDYTPTGTFFGTDTFHYYTTDGSLQTAIVTVTLDVQASVGTPAEDDGGTDSGNGGQAAGEASINNDGASVDTDATLLDAQTTAVTDATTDGANQRDGLGAEEALPAIPTLVNNEFLTEMFLDNVPESGWQSLNVPVHKFNLQNAPLDSASNTVFRSVGSNGPALTEFFLDFLPESSGRSGAEQPAYMEFTEKLIVGSSVVVSTSFSVGYVVWMLRGGSPMTAFMSSLPAWQAFDPLPIIDSFSIDDEHADDDSLISLVRD